jgi:DNA-binding GntR family transcriptional regulator
VQFYTTVISDMSFPHQTWSPADLAYEKIKQGIVALRYPPGEKLSEARLAAELQLGRSPIRSALSRLEGENWVRVFPQSGTFVREVDPRQVEELAELRLLLEAHTTRIAAMHISAKDLEQLRGEFDALKAKGAEDHIADFWALDDHFHSSIYRVAGNRRIEEILRNLKDQIRWVRAATATLPGRVTESLLEMDRVLNAMETRDPEAAAEAMSRHIGNIATSFKTMPRDQLSRLGKTDDRA